MTKKEIEILFKAHYEQMYRLAASILLDEDESRDVVSEVFARLLRKDMMLIADCARSYLMQSVRHAALNVLERRRVTEQFLQTMTDADLLAWDTDDEQQQAEELMRYVEDTLPPLTIEIFHLRYLQEKTCQEIAKEVGVSRMTVHTHLRQAKEKLKAFFDTNH